MNSDDITVKIIDIATILCNGKPENKTFLINVVFQTKKGEFASVVCIF